MILLLWKFMVYIHMRFYRLLLLFISCIRNSVKVGPAHGLIYNHSEIASHIFNAHLLGVIVSKYEKRSKYIT
uniref:Secreted protein n=1 Tax=Lepeophtheirus salmonis TaxID=72036 RepID=A0A0K2VHK9_LEPSM